MFDSLESWDTRSKMHIVQLLSCVWLFATWLPVVWPSSLSFNISQSLLKLLSIELVILFNHHILCCPLFLLPSIFSSIRVFSNESNDNSSWLYEYLLWTMHYSPEKAMAPHSSTLAWKVPWMEEPSGLQSMGSLRVRHDWATSLSLFTFMHWRRKWQPAPVFLPGEFQGWGSLVGFHLWGHTESDTTEMT